MIIGVQQTKKVVNCAVTEIQVVEFQYTIVPLSSNNFPAIKRRLRAQQIFMTVNFDIRSLRLELIECDSYH